VRSLPCDPSHYQIIRPPHTLQLCPFLSLLHPPLHYPAAKCPFSQRQANQNSPFPKLPLSFFLFYGKLLLVAHYVELHQFPNKLLLVSPFFGAVKIHNSWTTSLAPTNIYRSNMLCINC